MDSSKIHSTLPDRDRPALIESVLWAPSPFWPEVYETHKGTTSLNDFIFTLKRHCPLSSDKTLQWDEHYFLFQRHMERLLSSAALLSFRVSEVTVLKAFENAGKILVRGCAAGQASEAMFKVRLVCSADGTVSISHIPLVPVSSLPVMFDISKEIIDETSPMTRHKTTVRTHLDRELKRAMNAGLFDTVFTNGYGDITEGTITNIFVDAGNDPLLTPPVSAGLLPGTLRAELLFRGLAVEGSVTPDMLRTARAIYLGNSVRGLLPARIASLKRA